MDESMLLNGVLRGVLGGGGRRSSRRALRYLTGNSGSFWSNPTTLLTAAGVAWGIFESMQNNGTFGAGAPGSVASVGGSGLGSTAATSSAGVAMPPLPVASTSGPAAGVSSDALRLVRLAISAAGADGAVSDVERTAILEQAKAAGASDVVEFELRYPKPLAEIVAGVSDPAQRATLYVLAFTIVRGDEQPGGAERIYLAQLANLLGLDPATVQQLEQNAGQRIDAAA
jgi:uncharacterized membrane protein YebE (DUF533 family)